MYLKQKGSLLLIKIKVILIFIRYFIRVLNILLRKINYSKET